MANVGAGNPEARALLMSLGSTDMTGDHTSEQESLEEAERFEPEVSPSATVPARAAAAVGAVYLLLLLVAARLPAPGGPWPTIIAIALFVYLPLAIIYHGVRLPLTGGAEFIYGLVSLGVWLGITGVEMKTDAPMAGPARSVALLMACMFFGMLASRVLRDRNVLVPACIVAAIADLVSVGWGFTGHALRETPSLVTKLSVAVPAIAAPVSTAREHFPIIATMGVGDLFFVAFFFAAAARFRLPLRRTFCFVYPLMAAAMILTITGALPWQGVPGLPFIAMGFLLANVRSFRFSREEWRALGIVTVALVILAAGLIALWLNVR
jgi:hypothetical protein